MIALGNHKRSSCVQNTSILHHAESPLSGMTSPSGDCRAGRTAALGPVSE
jgi:hypothetical protein